MFVKHLRLDRFGSWSDAKIEGLSPGLNLICDAGRATVHFARAMLFGFDSQTRRGFLPSDSRGFGGAITVSTPDGLQTISRYDDGSTDGRLTVEHEDGSLIGRRHVQELLGGVSASALAHLFAVDFTDRPNIGDLVAEAQAAGIDLRSQGSARRLAELRNELAGKRSELESVPQITETLEQLRVRHREVSDEIRSVEQRLDRLQSHDEDHRLEHEIRKLQSDIDAEQRNLQTLDARLLDLTNERCEQQAWQAGEADEFDQRLETLDLQLDRWHSMLQEVTDRKQTLQAAVRGDEASPPAGSSVREHLRQLENRVSELQAVLRSGDDDRWHSRQLRTTCAARLQEMRDDVYRICHELSRFEQNAQQIASSNELEQLSRCEHELQGSIRNLVQRRRQLLDQRPPQDTVVAHPEHAELCRCHAHPHAQTSGPDAQAVAELEAQIADTERRRDKSIKTLNELEGELTDVRSRFVSLDRGLSQTLAAQLTRLRSQLQQLEQDRRHAEQRHRLTVEIARREQQIEQLETLEDGRVQAEATAYLRRLSGGDYGGLDCRDVEICVEGEQGQRVSWSQLPEGARDQVYLALCLAIVGKLRSRGTQLPMILNGAFTNMESKDVPEAAEVIHDFARGGSQVLVCTRHEHVVNVFRLLNTPVHDVSVAAGPETSDKSSPRIHDCVPADSDQPERPAEAAGSAFFLHETCPIEDTPAIDEANAVRLRKIGVWTVGDLLAVDIDNAAVRLEYAGVTAELIASWKAQTLLLCRVPQLRPYDARLLVACGVTDPEQLQRMQPAQVREIVQRFAGSSRGQAVMMSGTEFELSRVTDWINEQDQANRRSSSSTRQSGPASRRRAEADYHSGRSNYSPSRRSKSAEENGRGKFDSGNPSSVLKFDDSASLQFYLSISDPVVDAPSIGPRTAERLVSVGVATVGDLLESSPDELARRLQHSRTSPDTVRQWQQQAALACRIPQMRAHDAQILVALEITDPAELARHTPEQLWNKVAPFIKSSQGKRIIRNGKSPDLEEIKDWIHWASAARTLAAA